MEVYSVQKSREEWRQARQTAFIQDVLGAFAERPAELLPFEVIRQKLQLRNARYRGLEDVPLERIVGSVGRTEDFTRAFFPRREALGQRWQKVDQLALSATGLSPVELYKVGDIYFVRDGNHRVSVAKQHEAKTIQAYVTEYPVRVSLDPDVDMADLLTKAAHESFLEQTQLDKLCPDTPIELSYPDGYDDLLNEIATFQDIIASIDEREIPFEEAVALWCEMRYTPIVEIIRSREIMREFPDCTEADLYLWLRRSQEELRVRYGTDPSIEDTAGHLVKQFGGQPSLPERIRRLIGRFTGGVGELGGRVVDNVLPPVEDDTTEIIRQNMISFMKEAVQERPRYRFTGSSCEEWQAWHAEFQHVLWDILGVSDKPWRTYTVEDLDPELEEQVSIDGVVRELIWIKTEERMDVPVYLFLPPGLGEPRPAVVVFPGHGTIDQTAGVAKSYQNANALELARAGFVTLTMELRGFGKLGPIGHLKIDAAARLLGRTWYGLLVQDAMRAIDYLHTRPDVLSSHIGATGIGAGGALAMYTAALDGRIQTALVHSYLNKYIVTSFDEDHCPCNDIPGIRRYADMGDVASLIAPRPVLFVNGLSDPSSNPAARESFAIVNQVYRVTGAYNRAQLIEPERMGHEFDNQLASGWFRRWLTRDVDLSTPPSCPI